MHTEAKSEIWLLVFSCVTYSLYLTLDTSVAETAGNQYTVAVVQKLVCRFGSYFFGVDEFYFNVRFVFKTGMTQRFHNGKVCVGKGNILSDKTDNGVLCGIVLTLNHIFPFL